MKTIIKNSLRFIRRLKLISSLGLYDRRLQYFPNKKSVVFGEFIFSRMCKVKLTKEGWLYDKSANISYDPNTDIGKKIYYTGKFEEEEINFLKASVLGKRQYPVVIDIGANVGIHSIEFAKSSEGAIVHSFEPSPHTREMLIFNVNVCKMNDQIIIHPNALSDHSGKAIFYHTDDDAYSSLKDTKRKKVISTIEVDLITIDQIVSENGFTKIDLIKIDVEGFEHEVVCGGLETFKKFKPELFIEIYRGANSNLDPEMTIRMLINIGYNVYVLENGVPKNFTKHSDSYYNYYFTMSVLDVS